MNELSVYYGDKQVGMTEIRLATNMRFSRTLQQNNATTAYFPTSKNAK
jgi:hypothetical protein